MRKEIKKKKKKPNMFGVNHSELQLSGAKIGEIKESAFGRMNIVVWQ